MNKRDMRKEAVERLKSAISVEGEHLSYGRVIEVLSGRPTYTEGAGVYAETLIDLLTDDDTDEYVKLPVDANGETIHIGDVVIVNARGRLLTVDGVGRSGYDVIFCDDRPGYTAYVAKTCHRYHKPTVDEILDELEGMRGTGDYDAVVERCADLAGMLRELLKEVQECE